MRSSRKTASLLIAFAFAASAATTLADAVFVTVASTPYDKQMTRIEPLLSGPASAADATSLALVNGWMADLRGIPYGFTKTWKTPDETESGAPADCKAKAVDLYTKMRSAGATNVRLVIGRRTSASRSTHAWLQWETGSGSYVLDPTFDSSATAAQKIHKDFYVPLYAFAGAKKFRAETALVAQK